MTKYFKIWLVLVAGTLILPSSCYYDKAENILGPNACDTLNVSFSQHIVPYVNSQCVNCHSGSSPSAGIDLSNYITIKASVVSGTFGGSINHNSGYSPMPKGMSKTEPCTLNKINRWINQGAPNN